MKIKTTSTEKLLAGALVLSLLTTLLHPTLPAILCMAVHIGVTGIVSAVHIRQVRTNNAKEALLTINDKMP